MAAPSGPPHNELLWRIENYGWYEGGPDIELASGALTAHRIHGTQWSVLVHTKSDDDDDRLVARLRRHVEDEGPRVVDIVCRMAVVDVDGRDSDQAATVTWNGVERGASGEDVVLASRSAIFGNRGKYLPAGTLTIRVKLWRRSEQDGPPTSETRKTAVFFDKRCLTWTVRDRRREARVPLGTRAEPEMFEMIFTPHSRYNPAFSADVNLADDIFDDSTLCARSQIGENRNDASREPDAGRNPSDDAAVSHASHFKMINSNVKFFDPDEISNNVKHDEEDYSNKTFSKGVRRRSTPALWAGRIAIRQKVNWDRLIHVDGRISVLDSKNKVIMTTEDNHTFPAHSIGERWLYPKFIDSSKLESPSELRLHCDFVIFDGSMNHCVASPCSGRSNPEAVPHPYLVLEDRVGSLYWDEDCADLDLSLEEGGLTYAAHKWILAARSPVFRSMIEHMELRKKMCESVERLLQLEQEHGLGRRDEQDDRERGNIDAGPPKRDVLEVSISPDYVKPFLKFLYTDKLCADDLNGEDLLRLYLYSRNFEVPLLGRECVRLMRTRFDFGLSLTALSFGHHFRDQQLMEAAENYVAHHRREIMLSEVWARFVKDYPDLVGPVMAKLRSKSQSLNLYDFEN